MALRVVLLLWAVCSLQAQMQEQLQARLDQLREDAGSSGITAGIALPGGAVVRLASGWTGPDQRTRLKPTDRMLAGSTGKTFAAAVILQAVDEGKLDLDSTISRWLGEEEWFGRLPNANDLTLRLLLSHRSGINDYVLDKEFAPAFSTNIEKNWSARELVANLFDKKALFPAGSAFAYADANFVLAGLVYETATGRKLFAEVTRRLLTPKQFEHTVTSESRIMTDLVPGWMQPNTPFGLEGPTVKDGHLLVNAQVEYAGGGMISNAGDLAQWAAMLWDGKAFSEAMLRQVLDAKPTGTGRGGGREARYGLAVQVQPSDFGETFGHAGWFPGYQTEMVYFPDHKIAIAVQVNSDPLRGKRSPRACLNELMKVVLGSRTVVGQAGSASEQPVQVTLQ